MVDISQYDFNDLAVCAFRYAMGRKTYITSYIADILIKHKNDISPQYRNVITREIELAFEANNYGMEMDKIEWERVLNELS